MLATSSIRLLGTAVTALTLALPSAAYSADVAVTGFGDTAGYHVLVGAASGRTVTWREVAVLKFGGVRDRGWTGSQCVTADGRYAAVTVLPLSAANRPALVGRGAKAYAVDLRARRARLLAEGVAVGYDTPVCGAAGTAALRAAVDDRAGSTRVSLADLSRGQTRAVTVDGQLTSVTPHLGGVVAARGPDLVRVDAASFGKRRARARVLSTAAGVIYDVREGSNGDLFYLSARFGGGKAHLWRLRDGRARRLDSGPRVGSKLLGRGTRLVAQRVSVPGVPAIPMLALRAASSAGGFAIAAPESDGSLPRAVTIPSGRPLAARRTGGAARVTTSPRRSARLRLATAASAAQPACAVPRLDPARQVMQPNSAQVNSAAQLAARGLLTGGNGRAAGYANMGLPAYAPNGDFPRIPLRHPAGDGWDTVPRSVIQGILAQESNWQQASFHALPGIAGGPIIGDYYGTGGNAIDFIDYGGADCGYGIAQVTDGMRAGQMAPELQAKIAVDYAENIAAGLRILQQKWNQLYDAGIIANDGNPRYLENWYFALWAYNTGIQPGAAFGNTTGCTPGPSCTGPDGTWGLGWLNNPANPAYPPNRGHYLQSTYDDARHPSDWPYQERVFGWMASPLRWGEDERYAPADLHHSAWLNPAPAAKLCTPQDNRCSGASPISAGTCSLESSQCWWHAPVTWIHCPTYCATSDYTVPAGAPEPGGTNPHPPQCRPDGLPAGADAPVIVDDLPAPGLNLVYCVNHTWATNGTFTYLPGRDESGLPVGEIDTHQLGAGFGGHMLFTHGEPATAPAKLINRGVWTPNLPGPQYYDVLAFVASTGADLEDATYVIDTGGYGNPFSVTANQHHERNVWIPLGRFPLGPGAKVTLSNISRMTPETVDVAFDAVAFVPQGGQLGEPAAPAATVPTPVPPPAGSIGAQPPPAKAKIYTRCDPGSESGAWNVFRVTVKCIGSGQVFQDPVLAPGARCIVKTGIELLPITRLAKIDKAITTFKAEIRTLRKELKAIDRSFPRRVDAGLEALSKSIDLYQSPVRTSLEMVVTSRLVLVGVRGSLKHPRKDKRLMSALTHTQAAGAKVLDILTPIGSIYDCKAKLSAR